jgi:hypothetical protein
MNFKTDSVVLPVFQIVDDEVQVNFTIYDLFDLDAGFGYDFSLRTDDV